MQTFGFDIWSFFSRSCFEKFDDTEKGFYTVFRKVFETIKAEEEKAKQDRHDDDDSDDNDDNNIDIDMGGKQAPGFGDSKLIAEKVIEFYKYWENFQTYKQFAWKDLYNLNEAFNRQVKRLMQKDNKKERQKEKKKYLDTIKNLVEFVKKRDLRYQEFMKNQIIEKQKKQEAIRKQEEEKIKLLQELREKQRKQEAERYLQESLKQGNEEENNDNEIGENVYYEDFYCEICNKEFKTENQLVNHKQSKLHKKKIKDIFDEVVLEEEKEEIDSLKEIENKTQDGKDETKKEKKKRVRNKKNKQANEKWGLNIETDSENEEKQNKDFTSHDKKEANDKKSKESENEFDDPEIEMIRYLDPSLGKQTKNIKDFSTEQEINDVKNNNEEQVENSSKETIPKKIEESKLNELFDSEDDANNQTQKPIDKKLNKAKLKKLKKQQKKEETLFQCNICKENFQTRNKLFQHIKDTGHALK